MDANFAKAEVRRARPDDIDQLLTLYYTVYGPHYPLSFGTDRESMRKLILTTENLWFVVENSLTGSLIASCIFEVENGIARVQGLVVHPEHRQKNIASKLLELGTNQLLFPRDSQGQIQASLVHCLYATTRTHSAGPQRTFLKNGFIPLGILPNSRRLKRYETLTLMARYAPGVLEKRERLEKIPAACAPIYKIVQSLTKSKSSLKETVKTSKPFAVGPRLEFELILAPQFVQRRFEELKSQTFDRFYPFHRPNLLISASNGEVDLFASFNQEDGYCTLISSTQPLWTLGGRLRPLMETLRDFGAAYVETLLPAENLMSMEALLDVQFLPSAYFPALLKKGDNYSDRVLMTRTMEPVNFHGMELDKIFKPHVDQYVELWKRMHLDVLSIFQDEKSTNSSQSRGTPNKKSLNL